MAGSSCQFCIFSQYQDQSQVGCALNRAKKYGYVEILNESKNGFYWVTPNNICTGCRDKSWLSQHPRNPVQTVRQELYPKLQLIVLIDKVSEAWVNFFLNNKFEKYSAVDVLVFEPEKDFVKDIGFAFSYANFFIHACFPIEQSICSAKQHHINNFVRKDCQFYLTINNPEYEGMDEWPDRLDYYLNDLCKSVVLVYDTDDEMEEDVYEDSMLVYTPFHFSLGGFGSQDIIDKISIYCINNEAVEGIHSYDDFWMDDEAVYNTEEGSGDEPIATT